MNRARWLPGMLLTLALPAQGDLAARLAEAERAYRLAEFARAEALHTAAVPLAIDRQGAVHFDLGNCAMQQGRAAEAVLHYRSAARRLPDLPAVAHNLAIAWRRLGLPGDVPPAPRAGAELLPLLLAGLLPVVGALLSARGRGARTVVAGGLLLAGVGVGIVVARQQWGPRAAEVVLLRATELRSGAAAGAAVLAALSPGWPLRVQSRIGDWYEVAGPMGRGFVAAAAVGLVE